MKLLLTLSFLSAAFVVPALADEPLQQGRSVGVCSDRTLVCAFMKDGHAMATNECQAVRDQAVRILPGDCWDED